MPITGALAGYDEQQLANEQQQGNQQSIQLNALQIAAAQAQQVQQQREQAAIQNAAAYANTPDVVDNPTTPTSAPPAMQTAASTYPLGQGPKTPSGNAAVGPDMGVGTSGDGTPNVTAKPNVTQADYNDKIAQRLAAQGFPNLANAAWNQASDARQNALKIAAANSSQLAGNLKNMQSQAELVGQHMQGVNSQDSYDQAINQMAVEGMPKQELDILRNHPYDPNFVNQLVTHASTVNQMATQKLNALKLQSTNDWHKQELAARKQLETQKEAAAAAQKAAAERNSKNGQTTAPSNADIDSASAAVRQTLYQGAKPPDEDKDMVNSLTSDVAARAKQLVKQNRGMDMATASYQALQELQASGQLKKVTTNTKTFMHPFTGENNTNTSYAPKGISSADAMKDPGSPSQRVVGRWYQTPQGPRQWLGTQ